MLPLQAHRAARLEALQAEDGWLNLTDRVELSGAPQTVGSGQGAEVQISRGPDLLGTIDPKAETFQLEGGETLQFQRAAGGFLQVRLTDYLLEIHEVDGEIALRMRDLTLPRHADLQYFPENPAWIIRARWQALEVPRAQAVDQKGGETTSVTLTHTAHFTHEGQEVTLLATHWKGDKPMFVIRDKTSGVETYAASRFLIGEDASDGEITLDFNRAFSPPCSFTDFAICPLPPRENILPFRIEAGERLPA